MQGKNKSIAYNFAEDANRTYAEIFGVNAENYADTIITYEYEKRDLAYSLSVREKNVLRRNGYNTLEKLLLLTPVKLGAIHNIGVKSVKNIEIWLENVIKKNQEEIAQAAKGRGKYIFQLIRLMLQGDAYSLDSCTNEERAIFAEAVKAAELFGNDFCLKLMNDELRPYVDTIEGVFQDFNIQRIIMPRFLNGARKAVSTWSPELLPKLIRPYLHIFCISNKKEGTLAELENFFGDKVTVQQYAEIIADAIDSKNDKILSLTKALNAFQNWMSGIDLDLICKNIFDQDRGIKYDILHARAEGATLDKIGRKYNLTRERIRQIEKKSLDNIKTRLFRRNNNLFLLISAYHNGNCILSKEKITEAIGTEYTNFLWFYATISKNHGVTYFLDNKIASYDAGYRAIVVHNGTFRNYVPNSLGRFRSKIKKIIGEIIDELPELMETVELQTKLYTIADESKLPYELLQQAAAEQYKKAGRYSHKGSRITVVRMCDIVLQECFQDGYKIGNETSVKLFQKQLIVFFGAEGRMTARAIDSQVSQIGVLIGSGKYMHQNYIHIDDEIVRKIFDYIESSPKTALTYSEIFSALKNVFQGTMITNQYVLHGIIKLYNRKYTLHRDFISKNNKGKLDDEFIKFMKLNGIVHKSKISKEFALQDYNVMGIAARCPEIITLGNGYLMHDSRLHVDENISNTIRQYLDTAVSDIPISARYLQNYFMANFTNFMVKNEINNHHKLFGVLKYMFDGEYRFDCPYICRKNAREIKAEKITTRSTLNKYLEGIDSIEISDLIYICKKNGINILSTNYIIDMLAPEFIRVNVHTLMRSKNIGFSQGMQQYVAKLIFQAIEANNGYISIRNIKDFSWYPMINIPWTQFLLESIAKLIPGINIINIHKSADKLPQGILVSDKYANEEWESLLLKLLKAEHDINPFASITDVYEWLKKEGLCSSRNPNYLERDNHILYANNGKLIIE